MLPSQVWKWVNWLLPPVLVILIFTLPRQQDLDQYVTADEPMYIRESGGFYAAVRTGAYTQTNRVIQPGVPSLWMGALAFYRLYPAYAAPGNLETSDFQLWTKLQKTPFTLMQLLVLGRLHSLRLLALAALVAFLYARSIFGLMPALVGFWLMAFDPFYLAHSQLLATDAPLAAFLLVALLALVRYYQTRQPYHMGIAGIFAGLAALSKVTGLVFLPFALVIWLLSELQPAGTSRCSWKRLFQAGVLLLAFSVFVFLAWPALWGNAPQIIRQLGEFSLRSASGEVNSNSYFLGKMIPNGNLGGLRYAIFYPLTFLWRSSPLTLFGLLWLIVFWKTTPQAGATRVKTSIGLLLAFALLFSLFMTVSSKKIDRYLLPVYPITDLAAGVGWIWMARWLWNLPARRIARPFMVTLLILMLVGQFLIQQSAMPYPIAYYNPLLGGAPAASRVLVSGWGEGLDQAARFLNNQPHPKELQVFSWYAAALNLQFVGRADDLPISGAIDDEFFKRILASDYVVIYTHMWQRRTSSRLLDYLADKPYVFSANIHGLQMVRIYDLKELGVMPLQ